MGLVGLLLAVRPVPHPRVRLQLHLVRTPPGTSRRGLPVLLQVEPPVLRMWDPMLLWGLGKPIQKTYSVPRAWREEAPVTVDPVYRKINQTA